MKALLPSMVVPKMVAAIVLLPSCCSIGLLAQSTQSAKPAQPIQPAMQGAGLDAIQQARVALRAAEAAHPGNTPEICKALEELVGLQLDAHLVTDETMSLVRREVLVAETGPGPHSAEYVSAIDELAEVLIAFDRTAEARPYAEKAFEVASVSFPDTNEYGDSALTLSFVCRTLGDYPCALRTAKTALEIARKHPSDDPFDIVGVLSNMAQVLNEMGDKAGAASSLEEALAYAYDKAPDNPHMAIIENNLGAQYSQNGEFAKAIVHLNKSIELEARLYGNNTPLILDTKSNLAQLYSRSGQFDLAFRYHEEIVSHARPSGFDAAHAHSNYARTLAAGGKLTPAIQQGLMAARLGRENFILGARTLPERQALAYDKTRAHGLDLALSVLAKHPDLPRAETFQEVVRSRALVADEMARRQKNINRNNNPEVARLLRELDEARSALLALEQSAPTKAVTAEQIGKATEAMERAEAAVAQKSATFRHDERISSIALEDLRRNMPKRSVLISYVHYGRSKVEAIDPTGEKTPSYIAFVLHPDTGKIRAIDLGQAKEIDSLVESARKTVDSEMQSGGIGGKRNEHAYREAASALRARIWDPILPEFAGAKLLLVVPDGELNLIPFAAFPDGNGYWLDHGPVIHLLSSERDLIPEPLSSRKSALVAIGNPAFNGQASAMPLSEASLVPAIIRGNSLSCDEFKQVEFHPLPESALEVQDISAQWLAANATGAASQLLGVDATRDSFLREAVRGRVLHVATHAFLLSQSCGDGNPLLHSGLVFAGANNRREDSLLTAQQIASLELSGVDWAVLSACNTGTGELHDGEGVLGLQRAFRVAGAHSVIMTLWPVDDSMSRRYMHELYTQRFGLKATTADAVWNASRKLLADQRAAGQSTHPWYWAGFVGSGSWE
jgi:CHAT domain-containing protein